MIDQYWTEKTGQDKIGRAQSRTNRLICVIASTLSNFEGAVFALYGNNPDGFAECIKLWPADIRKCAEHYSDGAWGLGEVNEGQG